MFYDEEMILDLRLNYLDQYVEKFIIVESSFTHSGKKRKLIFDLNKFKKFREKISYIILDEEPKNLVDIYGNESYDEKNSKYIMNALKKRELSKKLY